MTNYERKLKWINKSYVEELSDRQLKMLESKLFVAHTMAKISQRHLVEEVQDIVRKEIKTRRLEENAVILRARKKRERTCQRIF